MRQFIDIIFILLFSLIINNTNIQASNIVNNHAIYDHFNRIFDRIEEFKYNDTDSSKTMVMELYRLSNTVGNPIELESKAIFQDVFSKSAAGVSVDSISRIIIGKMNGIDTATNKFEMGLLTIAMAESQMLLGDYVMAINYSLRALSIFSNLRDGDYTAMSNNIIGKIFIEVGDYNNGIKHFNKALAYYTETNNTKRQLMVKTNIGFYYISVEQPSLAEKIIKEVIEELNGSNEHAMIAIAYAALGILYADDHDMDRNKKSYRCYINALSMAKRVNNDNITSIVKHNLASYYLRANKPDSAYSHYKELEHIYINNHKLVTLMSVYSGLAEYFAKVNKFDSAYYYYDNYDSLRTTLMGDNRIANVHNISVKYAFSEYENKLIISDKENQLKRRYNIIIILSLVVIILAILIVLFIVIYQKKIIRQRENINIQKAKIKEIEIRELNDRITNEEKISHLQKEKFKMEIDSKNREICSALLLVSGKNNILKSVNQLIENCDKGNIPFSECRSKTDSIIKTNLKLDDEWYFFKLHFEKVHPEFFHKLKDSFKALTENDLRLCAYIRIGMRTKQIAQMLALSPDSVKVNKYRLKKKLGIINDDESSLDEFIRKF